MIHFINTVNEIFHRNNKWRNLLNNNELFITKQQQLGDTRQYGIGNRKKDHTRSINLAKQAKS